MITHRYLHGAAVDERLVHWQYDQNTGAEVSERFYHRDHQGSIIAMSDASGNRPAGELYTYDAYGNMVTGNTSGQPFRYTGRRWDDETGLYYYRARYYSASLGRFLQTDPIGYEDNMNMYGYVGNDPVNKTDPTGNADLENFIRQFFGVPEGGFSGAVERAAFNSGPTDVPSNPGEISNAALGEMVVLTSTGLIEGAQETALAAPAGKALKTAQAAARITKVATKGAKLGARVSGSPVSRNAINVGNGTTDVSKVIVKPQVMVNGKPLSTSGIPRGAISEVGAAPKLRADIKPSPSSEKALLRAVRKSLEAVTGPEKPN